MTDPETIPLKNGTIYLFPGEPKVTGNVTKNCLVTPMSISGIPGRSVGFACGKFVNHRYVTGVEECIFCDHWKGPKYEEVLKALTDYTRELDPPANKKEFNRFSEIDLVM